MDTDTTTKFDIEKRISSTCMEKQRIYSKNNLTNLWFVVQSLQHPPWRSIITRDVAKVKGILIFLPLLSKEKRVLNHWAFKGCLFHLNQSILYILHCSKTPLAKLKLLRSWLNYWSILGLISLEPGWGAGLNFNEVEWIIMELQSMLFVSGQNWLAT